jgi:hypothetical protein
MFEVTVIAFVSAQARLPGRSLSEAEGKLRLQKAESINTRHYLGFIMSDIEIAQKVKMYR